MHNCKRIGDSCDVGGVLYRPVFASSWRRQATCRWPYSSNAERSLLPFSMGDVWYLRRLRTLDDVSLPPNVSAPPTFFLGDFARVLLCCRRLLRIWIILADLNLALLCLPVIFTAICFRCLQCRLGFKSRSWVAIHYNPPSSSVGLHVFIPGNLSVLSGGTVIL